MLTLSVGSISVDSANSHGSSELDADAMLFFQYRLEWFLVTILRLSFHSFIFKVELSNGITAFYVVNNGTNDPLIHQMSWYMSVRWK